LKSEKTDVPNTPGRANYKEAEMMETKTPPVMASVDTVPVKKAKG
jgi:hypothetical protein